MIEMYPIPAGIPENLERNRPVVVIDVFRASTSIASALAAGAREVYFASSRREAEQIRDELGSGALLAGERDGYRREGYDLGNSPLEMKSDKVSGKAVIFDSTNGTRLIKRLDACADVIIGSFATAGAAVKLLKSKSSEPIFACAGQLGKVSLEDSLAAGYIISLLGRPEWELDDAACEACRMVKLSEGRFPEWARNSYHGRYLSSIGLAADVSFCIETDRFDFVPIKSGKRIVRSG